MGSSCTLDHGLADALRCLRSSIGIKPLSCSWPPCSDKSVASSGRTSLSLLLVSMVLAPLLAPLCLLLAPLCLLLARNYGAWNYACLSSGS